jgi:hypothetical protein
MVLLNKCDQAKLEEDNFPVFYKLKIRDEQGKWQYRSAIDIALENNQVRACNLIINHIVKYQNSYCFIFLFQDNFLNLLMKGISVANLLESDIFSH